MPFWPLLATFGSSVPLIVALTLAERMLNQLFAAPSPVILLPIAAQRLKSSTSRLGFTVSPAGWPLRTNDASVPGL